jgi:hypothetical protein
MDECAKLREKLGKQLEELSVEIAKHQRALLQEGCAGERQAEDPVVRTIVKQKENRLQVLQNE